MKKSFTKRKQQSILQKVSLILAIFLIIITFVIINAFKQPQNQPSHAASTITGLKVQGNRIVNSTGQPVQLRGVSISGTEFLCVQSGGVFNGPADQGLQAIISWKANVVRIPLNEDCWLGINNPKTNSTTYQQAITGFVNQVTSNGLAAIVELHWNAPGTELATGQKNMADADHAIEFWKSVATSFKGNSSVIFELYNEPHDIDWNCWRDGGNCAGFQAAGMQQMVDAVRSTGATNIVLMGGLAWSNDLSQWLTHKPQDPLNNIGATWHVYNFNTCNNTSCWDTTAGPVAAQVPIIVTEMGQNDCKHDFIDKLMDWLDQHNQNYLGWAWFPADCGGFPSIISDYNGTPTNLGIGLKNRLAQSNTTNPTPSTLPSLSATPTPPYATPSNVCLGSCPTLSPTPTSGQTESPTPTVYSPQPSLSPSEEISITPQPTSTTGPICSERRNRSCSYTDNCQKYKNGTLCEKQVNGCSKSSSGNNIYICKNGKWVYDHWVKQGTGTCNFCNGSTNSNNGLLQQLLELFKQILDLIKQLLGQNAQ
jgi:hypothetical protein